MLKTLVAVAIVAIAVGISFQLANAAEPKEVKGLQGVWTPEPLYEDKLDQKLYLAGVSFAKDGPGDRYFIMPGGKPLALVPGYDTVAGFCESTKGIRKVHKVVIYSPTGRLSGSCK